VSACRKRIQDAHDRPLAPAASWPPRPGRCRFHDGSAGALGDRATVSSRRAAVADRRRASPSSGWVATRGQRAGPRDVARVECRDDDVDRPSLTALQAAPPRTQNLAQCGWLSRHRADAVGQGLAELELRVVGQEGAGDDRGPRRALALHDHAGGGAHHAVGRLPEDAPAGGRDLRHVDGRDPSRGRAPAFAGSRASIGTPSSLEQPAHSRRGLRLRSRWRSGGRRRGRGGPLGPSQTSPSRVGCQLRSAALLLVQGSRP
jgi:hypothetical protein